MHIGQEYINLKDKVQQHKKDTGSVEVQIIDLTERINELSKHFEANPKDFNSRMGLLKLVNRRRKFLSYVKNHNSNLYQELLEGLNIRK